MYPAQPLRESPNSSSSSVLSASAPYVYDPLNCYILHKVTEADGVPDLSETGYDTIRYMGTCTGGHIYLGKEKKKLNDFVAIKKFNTDDVEDYALIAKEATNLRMLNHPNILELNECFVFESSVYQISPAMNLGSLSDIVFNYKKYGISEKAIAGITRQVLDALIYLHQRRYIHRNVKPKHILIDSKGNVKLSGFRLMIELALHLDCAFDFDNHLQNQICYMAPECLTQNMQGYNSKSDIYMLGVSICEAVNGVVPYAELAPLEMLHRKLNEQVPRPVDSSTLRDDERRGINIVPGDRPSEHLKRQFSTELHDFVANCLSLEANKRMSAAELKKSAWLGSRANHHLGPKDISEALELDYKHFNLALWERVSEPLIKPEPEPQYYDGFFDYAAIS